MIECRPLYGYSSSLQSNSYFGRNCLLSLVVWAVKSIVHGLRFTIKILHNETQEDVSWWVNVDRCAHRTIVKEFEFSLYPFCLATLQCYLSTFYYVIIFITLNHHFYFTTLTKKLLKWSIIQLTPSLIYHICRHPIFHR